MHSDKILTDGLVVAWGKEGARDGRKGIQRGTKKHLRVMDMFIIFFFFFFVFLGPHVAYEVPRLGVQSEL